MSTQPNAAGTTIQETIEAILADGQDVRNRVAKLITDRAEKYQLNKDGLLNLTRSTMDEARTVLDKSLPQDQDAVLRQVVDGVGDGLSTAVLASRLAFEEARAHQKAYAEEDLSRLSHDLRTLADSFVETVSHAASKYKSTTATDLSALRSHAEKTAGRLIPVIKTTLSSIAEQPLQFGKETIGTGVKMTQQAVGALFAAIGQRMSDAGKKMSS